MNEIYTIAIFAAILTGFSQLLLKTGASYGAHRNNLLLSYLNLRTISGYFLFLVITLLNVYVYQTLPLKAAVTLIPLSFISVALLSIGVLKEQLSRTQFAGIALVLIGISVFNL